MSPRVLLVDDEPLVREVVAGYLARDGMQVAEAADGRAALDWLEHNDADLVVLDVMLPEVDGIEILRTIRRDRDTPVILLTARAEEVDRVVGLELGADDYVVKPFSPRELVARVKTILRRAAGPVPGADPGAGRLDFGTLVVDVAARELLVDGVLVGLTPKEFDLVATLASSPRRVFSRAQLLELVWDSSPAYQDAATVTVHVGRVRQKIEVDPEAPRWIATVRGIGYRFEP